MSKSVNDGPFSMDRKDKSMNKIIIKICIICTVVLCLVGCGKTKETSGQNIYADTPSVETDSPAKTDNMDKPETENEYADVTIVTPEEEFIDAVERNGLDYVQRDLTEYCEGEEGIINAYDAEDDFFCISYLEFENRSLMISSLQTVIDTVSAGGLLQCSDIQFYPHDERVDMLINIKVNNEMIEVLEYLQQMYEDGEFTDMDTEDDMFFSELPEDYKLDLSALDSILSSEYTLLFSIRDEKSFVTAIYDPSLIAPESENIIKDLKIITDDLPGVIPVENFMETNLEEYEGSIYEYFCSGLTE